MKLWLVSAIVVAAIAAFGLWFVDTRTAHAPSGGTVFCAQDVQECADGSFVSRTGPSCEFAACPGETATGGQGIVPYDSGVEGTVSVGPTCPVEHVPPDPACADKPYATAILVYRTGSQTPFVIGNSGADGAFKLALPPGSYTVTAGSGKALPRCSSTSVAVVPREYATADLSCDSGIR